MTDLTSDQTLIWTFLSDLRKSNVARWLSDGFPSVGCRSVGFFCDGFFCDGFLWMYLSTPFKFFKAFHQLLSCVLNAAVWELATIVACILFVCFCSAGLIVQGFGSRRVAFGRISRMAPKKRKSASGSDAKAKAAKLPDGGDSDKSQWIRQLTAWPLVG